ncbi:MAG: RidA family protein [Chloroflexi bacterium]|nr:RidA family protein [Chloroflexota bacterium]
MKREVIDTPGVAEPGSYYTKATKAGPFLFLAGFTGRIPGTKRYATSLDDLPPEVAKQLSSGDIHADASDGAILAQSWIAYTQIKKILEGAGSSLDNMMQATVYLTDLRRYFGRFNQVRRMFIKSPPPSTVLQVQKLGINDDCLLEITVIALVPDEK